MRGKPAARGVARRYARALLEVADARGEAEVVRQELADAVAVIRSHRDLQAVLEHPAVSAEKKKQIVAAVFATAKASALLRRLLELLADRDRMSLLPDIEAAYSTLWNEQRGIVAAEATTAVPLDQAQRDGLAAAIARATGRRVELRADVDPGIGGGVLVRMLGRTYDGSVRGRLRAMRRRLVEGVAQA